MGWTEAIGALIQAICAYFIYRFDPKQIARRDAINAELTKEKNRAEIDQLFADKNTLMFAYFISEYTRIVRAKGKTDNSTGRESDLLDRILPPPRNEEDRNQDPTEGPDIG